MQSGFIQETHSLEYQSNFLYRQTHLFVWYHISCFSSHVISIVQRPVSSVPHPQNSFYHKCHPNDSYWEMEIFPSLSILTVASSSSLISNYKLLMIFLIIFKTIFNRFNRNRFLKSVLIIFKTLLKRITTIFEINVTFGIVRAHFKNKLK